MEPWWGCQAKTGRRLTEVEQVKLETQVEPKSSRNQVTLKILYTEVKLL